MSNAMIAIGAIGATLITACAYAIFQAPDYGSPNYAEWNRMGYPNEDARQQFEPYRIRQVPRLF
jgi:hypothetical protein